MYLLIVAIYVVLIAFYILIIRDIYVLSVRSKKLLLEVEEGLDRAKARHDELKTRIDGRE